MKNHRRRYQESSKKLRRARRLYKYIVAPIIQKNPLISFPLAVRAVNAGLWSKNTAITDVVYSFVASAKRDWRRSSSQSPLLYEHIWWDFKYYYRKTPSGYTQIKKIRVVL